MRGERPEPSLGPPAGPLSPRAARVLYNVADALVPDTGTEPAGVLSGAERARAVDVLPGVEHRLRWKGVGAARRTWLLLMALEWQPLLTLRARRTFSQLPRALRRELLAGWAGRASFEELRRWIAEAADDAAKDAQPSEAADDAQSSGA